MRSYWPFAGFCFDCYRGGSCSSEYLIYSAQRKLRGATYNELERRVNSDTTCKTVDFAATTRHVVLHHLDLALWGIGCANTLLQACSVAVRKQGTKVALMLDAAGEYRHARTRRRTGLLLPLCDHNLVGHVIVDHVHLVLLGCAPDLAGRQDKHYSGFASERGDRFWVDADGSKVYALLVYG